MTPLGVVEAAAVVLWCHSLVLTFAWFRAVAGAERTLHVDHFVSLVEVLVPGAAAVLLLVVLGGALGLPSVVVFLAVVFPAGLVIGLQLEVDRLGRHRARAEARRLAVTLMLALAVMLWRGGA